MHLHNLKRSRENFVPWHSKSHFNNLLWDKYTNVPLKAVGIEMLWTCFQHSLKSKVSETSMHSTGFSDTYLFFFLKYFLMFPLHLLQSCSISLCPFAGSQSTERRNTPKAVCVCVCEVECVSEPELESFCVCQDTASICRAPEGNACLVSGGQQGGLCVALLEHGAWQFHAPWRMLHSPRCNALWSWRENEALGEWEATSTAAMRREFVFIYLFARLWLQLKALRRLGLLQEFCRSLHKWVHSPPASNLLFACVTRDPVIKMNLTPQSVWAGWMDNYKDDFNFWWLHVTLAVSCPVLFCHSLLCCLFIHFLFYFDITNTSPDSDFLPVPICPAQTSCICVPLSLSSLVLSFLYLLCSSFLSSILCPPAVVVLCTTIVQRSDPHGFNCLCFRCLPLHRPLPVKALIFSCTLIWDWVVLSCVWVPLH